MVTSDIVTWCDDDDDKTLGGAWLFTISELFSNYSCTEVSFVLTYHSSSYCLCNTVNDIIREYLYQLSDKLF